MESEPCELLLEWERRVPGAVLVQSLDFEKMIERSYAHSLTDCFRSLSLSLSLCCCSIDTRWPRKC